MTDVPDDLFDRLRAADPVDPTTLPTATDPAAHHLLETIMASTPDHTDLTGDDHLDIAASTPATVTASAGGGTAMAAADAPVRSLAPPTVNRRRRQGLARYRVPGLAAAAAVAVVALGATVLAPGGTSPALAAVQEAAAETAAADTGRVTTTLVVEGDSATNDESGTVTLEGAFAGDDAAVTVEGASATADPAAADRLDRTEARLINDVVYVNQDGSWMSMEVGGLLATTVTDYLDPRSVLEQVNKLTTAEEIGATTIDGVEVTHYRGVVDLAGQSMTEWLSGIDPGAGSSEAQAEGEATLDIHIDGDGLLRHLDVTGEAREPGGAESVTFTITSIYRDLGTDITIDVPAGATPVTEDGLADLGD